MDTLLPVSTGSLVTLSSLLLVATCLTVSVALTCFTNVCPPYNDTALCPVVCPPTQSRSCVRVSGAPSFPPAIFVTLRMGCSNENCPNIDGSVATVRVGELLCSTTVFPLPKQSCCCSEDYCNEDNALADLIRPRYSYGIGSPTGPVPPAETTSEIVCPQYNCTGNTCNHSYKVCDVNFCHPTDSHGCVCQSIYVANQTTNKLDLYLKGCLRRTYCDRRTCVIDVSFNGTLDDEYRCCCNESMCNVNETFANPTRLASYGMKECEMLNCEHKCVVTNNMLNCTCPTGLVVNGSTCTDIDECLNNNGGCHHICVNTRGSYHCICRPGYSLDGYTHLCFNKSTVFHCSYFSYDYINLSTTVCEDDRTCIAQYTYFDEEWVVRYLDCGPSDRTVQLQFSCRSECILEEIEGFFGNYRCCCTQTDCNNMSRIFPSSSVFSSSTSLFAIPSIMLNITEETERFETEIFWSLLGLVAGLILLLVSCILVLCINAYFRRRKLFTVSQPYTAPVREGDVWRSTDFTFGSVVHSSQFASVYQCSSNCIVSVYLNTALTEWNRERDIYQTPGLEHENILALIGAERMEGSHPGYWLVFSGSVIGNLYNYLQLNSVTGEEACRMGQSIASGLSRLHHLEHRSIRGARPAVTVIVHRDVTSHNILVRTDLTCAISNFSSSVKFYDGHLVLGGRIQAGNVRYMAPEVLDGSMELNSYALACTDVYSFGLVMWELLNCSQIAGNRYSPPFHDVVPDDDPSIELMKEVVVDRGITPAIPEAFSQRREYLLLVSSISDCFYSEPDARPNIHMMNNLLQTTMNRLAAAPPLSLATAPPLSLLAATAPEERGTMSILPELMSDPVFSQLSSPPRTSHQHEMSSLTAGAEEQTAAEETYL